MDFQQAEMSLSAVSARVGERLLKLHKQSS